MEDKRQPTTVTHMLSDPMWSLDHNIVVDKIARTVAEEPIGSGMLHAPMALAWRKKSKINFYSINDEFNIPSLSMVERIAKSVAEEPLEPGTNKEDPPKSREEEEQGDLMRERKKEQAQMEMYDDPYMNWSGHR